MKPEDVKEFVINNDDFGFEMRVAAAIREAIGNQVSHGATYIDPVSGKPRQFDIRFKIEENRATIYFAVECKNVSPSHPIIVCGHPADETEAFHDVIVSHAGVRSSHSHTHKVKDGAVYRIGDFVGKSILKPANNQKGKSNDSEIYDRWSQAIASAYDLVFEAMRKPTTIDNLQYATVFPWVVVPDGTLWQANYSPDGKLLSDPKPVNRVKFYVAHDVQLPSGSKHNPVCLSHIEFATLTGLVEFLPKLSRPALDWDTWIPNHIRERYTGG